VKRNLHANLKYIYKGITKQAGTESLNVCAGHLFQYGSLCAYLCISVKSLWQRKNHFHIHISQDQKSCAQYWCQHNGS